MPAQAFLLAQAMHQASFLVQMMQGNEQEDSSCKPPQKDSGVSPPPLHNQVCPQSQLHHNKQCRATLCVGHWRNHTTNLLSPCALYISIVDCCIQQQLWQSQSFLLSRSRYFVQKSFSQPDSPSTPSALSSGVDPDFTLDDSLRGFRLGEGGSSSSHSGAATLLCACFPYPGLLMVAGPHCVWLQVAYSVMCMLAIPSLQIPVTMQRLHSGLMV